MFNKKIFFLFGFLVLVTSVYSQKPHLNGSFIYGDQCMYWDNERWENEFQLMKDIGMEYVVIQYVAVSYPRKVTKMYYPSELPNTKNIGDGTIDIVDACLKQAENSGLKVFIGLTYSNKWWKVYAGDSTWLYNQMNFNNSVCDELWNKYKGKYPHSFYGWYWVNEIENVHFVSDEQRDVLTKAMNIQFDYLTSADKRLPFIISPFMNSKYGNAESYKNTWIQLFSKLHLNEGDIFCPQDNVGAGGLQLEEIDTWFAALKEAVNTKPGVKMWSNVETFENYDDNLISSNLGRVISQLRIEKPYVENYMSWEYLYYYSPYNVSKGYIDTYKDYLINDTLDFIKPSVPKNLNGKLLVGNSIRISWTPSTDNIGIMGYLIYRDNKLIDKIQVSEEDTTGELDNYYIDSELNSDTQYEYSVKSYDYAGNISDPSTSVSIKVSELINLSAGCSYTLSIAPSNTYPDVNNKKLTDGKFATEAYYADKAWVGFLNANVIEITIDLSKIVSVQSFIAEYLLDPQPAVLLPDSVSVSTSIDNITYTNPVALSDSSPPNNESSIHKYAYELGNLVEARYVKFVTKSNNAEWIFIDEFQVFGQEKTDVVNEPSKIKFSYKLSQNYPNPFNPVTTINFTLPKSEKVNISLFNTLGEKVMEVTNKSYSKGQHRITIDANTLSSGIYYYSLRTDDFSKTRKMLVVK